MLKLGIQELGEETFKKKLNNIPIEMASLLYCLYQKTKNNSQITYDAAFNLAKALGASFEAFSIDDIVEDYCALIEPVIQRKFTWNQDDIALQNIQSRVRSPSAWLLANVRNAILLCTSNRSESSVGYTTMDGDTAGSLCPIAGVDKSFILHWLKWLETIGLEEVGPLSILKMFTVQTSTAELRPLETSQTDEADLMPYDWLDNIERLFVFNKNNPLEILNQLCQLYPKEDPKNLASAIEIFIKLWVKNQWKRERLAPSFHLDSLSVDPKTWCRFPILSGGFKRELETMWQSIDN